MITEEREEQLIEWIGNIFKHKWETDPGAGVTLEGAVKFAAREICRESRKKDDQG